MLQLPCRDRELQVGRGPLLLSQLDSGPGLTAHRAHFGDVPERTLPQLLDAARLGGVRGRGGAGFPLARKLEAVSAGRRPVVVVNAAEGEPASAKDSALLRTVPHLVLDGAHVAARALGAREVHVVTATDRPETGRALEAALAERGRRPVTWTHHVAEPRFVSGQSRAVLELMAGRAGLPVTSWVPEATSGHRGRPTLLSNAETFAHLAVLAARGVECYTGHGTSAEPGTTLLTVTREQDDGRRSSHVVEVAHGEPLAAVLGSPELERPVLAGGYHGTWVAPQQLRGLRVSATAFREQGLTLGAGVLLPGSDRTCPVAVTTRVTDYLARQSAGRCGPCHEGLPALAQAVARLRGGSDTRPRIRELTGLVTRRGACAHPDGTARMVSSLLTGLPEAVQAHLEGACSCAARGRAAAYEERSERS